VSGLDIGVNTNTYRLLRLAKVARLVSLVKALEHCQPLYVMTTSLKGSLPTLGWIVILLFLSQLMFTLVIFSVLNEFYFSNESNPLPERQELYGYFGTFTKSMFTMFELMLANWPPVARMLSEYVSEYFMFFAVLYKLSMGFSVIGVVNGVLMQETFKVVAMDDTIMVRQKEMAVNAHRVKMTRLFQRADGDGTGHLDIDEFRAVLSVPEIQTWLSSMDIGVSDVDFLFAQCDENKTDKISVEDLIKGVSKIKGSARNVDMMKFTSEFKDFREKLSGSLAFADPLGQLSL
jgi:Ca2+-binding EF-hand superfamily protein